MFLLLPPTLWGTAPAECSSNLLLYWCATGPHMIHFPIRSTHRASILAIGSESMSDPTSRCVVQFQSLSLPCQDVLRLVNRQVPSIILGWLACELYAFGRNVQLRNGLLSLWGEPKIYINSLHPLSFPSIIIPSNHPRSSDSILD